VTLESAPHTNNSDANGLVGSLPTSPRKAKIDLTSEVDISRLDYNDNFDGSASFRVRCCCSFGYSFSIGYIWK
jgi:hypothetical protein